MSFSADSDPLLREVRRALSTVENPEPGLDIVSLGLVYAIERAGDGVRVVCTLNSMGCPPGPVIERDIADAPGEVREPASVETQLVLDPPWSPERMSDDAKLLFRSYG